MNDIFSKIKEELNVSEKQITTVLKLLEEGNTVPFIARYRKEMTGSLDEEQIRLIYKEYDYQNKLLQRKEEVIRLINEKEMLTPEIEKAINDAKILQEVEDIYLPFKEKRKTKATEAIKLGLEPLSKFILTFPKENGSILNEAKKYITKEVEDEQEAIEKAGHIIAEQISENAKIRQYLRDNCWKFGIITTKIKKDGDSLDEKKKYEMYYNFSQVVKKIPAYRILAFNRAEKEKVIKVSMEVNEEYLIEYIEKNVIKQDGDSTKYLKEFIKDSYKRLIFPSLEREIRAMLNEKASEQAIKLFSENLENLIMLPPIKEKIILGIDPAYRTGCKLAVIDQTGNLLKIDVIYPTLPNNNIEVSEEKITKLIDEYKINQVVIGNGTASRETQSFVKNYLEKNNSNIPVAIVSEAGASVYSASKNAQNEFPDLEVQERSAVSIARRIQDPMAELVKIDPKSIGVGQYQHDVNQKDLNENLDFVMVKCINKVGVNVNTASQELLSYVSGFDKTIAKNLVLYRNENGEFKNRNEIKNVKRLGPKTYEQAIGFLKIFDGDDILDSTFLHPESYELAKKIINEEKINLDLLGTDEFISEIEKIDVKKMSEKYETTEFLINDILDTLKLGTIDLREELIAPEFNSEVTSIEELKVGMKIKGQVRNLVEFGAFVDIGIKNDGLIHVSEISEQFVQNVEDYLQIGDIKDFYVKEVDLEKERVQLTLKN